MSEQRNFTIDFLRTIGVFLIVLAHVDPPQSVQEVRCFDVVLMVFLSGMSLRVSYKEQSYWLYAKKRILKLLIPTWVLLCVVFAINYVFSNIFEQVDKYKIVESFMLYDGIGYVWFVRITLMLSFVAPLLLKVNQFDNKQKVFWVGLLLLIILYCVAYVIWKSNLLEEHINFLFYLLPVYLFGYCIVYWIGIFYNELSRPSRITIFSIVIAGVAITKLFFGWSAANDKYPPGVIYLTYGVFISIILYEIGRKFLANKQNTVVGYISRNSFTIYLIHVIPLFLIKQNRSIDFLKIVRENWIIEYIFVLIVTAVLTLAYVKVKQMIKMRGKKKL